MSAPLEIRDHIPGEVPGQAWVANTQIQRLLATAMFGCLAWSLFQTLTAFSLPVPQSLATCLVATGAFGGGIALGGRGVGKNYRRYAEYSLLDWSLLLIPIILLLRLLPWLLQGPGAVIAEVGTWMDQPWRFWDATLVWGLLLTFFVWDLALAVADSLGKLGFQPGEIAPPGAPGMSATVTHDWESMPYRFVDYQGAWRVLMRLFHGGGALLLLFTGIDVVGPEALTNPNRPQVGGVIPVVLLYYVLGLIFASQTSLDRLRVSWLRRSVAVQPGLTQRWLAYGAILIVSAMILALLLPTSFAVERPEQLPLVWRWLWFIRAPLDLLGQALQWLLGWVLALLFAPFAALLPSAQPVDPAVPPGLARPAPAPVEPAQSYPSPTSRLVWSFFLYVVPTALAAFAIWNTWRKRRAIGQGLRTFGAESFRLLREALLDLAATLWRLFTFGSPRLARFAPQALRERLRRGRAARPAGNAPFRWLRLRGLAPRELVQYFYLSVVQRAEGVGWPRAKGQTPYEFSRDLANRLPERRGELDDLTAAFVRAKYSQRPVSEAEARAVRGPWQRLRDALQTRRRARQLGEWLFGKN
jgi:hypothetical protein